MRVFRKNPFPPVMDLILWTSSGLPERKEGEIAMKPLFLMSAVAFPLTGLPIATLCYGMSCVPDCGLAPSETSALLSQQISPLATPPVRLGANLPGVNRYSKEDEWGQTGGLAGWALSGKWARISSVPWAAYPEGYKGGQVDLNQIARQMEVCRGCAGVLVLLSPSEWPLTRDWIPPKDHWEAAIAATRRQIAEYDRQAKKNGLPPPVYQIWNEASPGKPGGPKAGAPGAWSPELHVYLDALTKGIGLPPERLVGPALSCLTDSPAERAGELATCSSPTGAWEKRCGAIALHLRLSGPGLSPEAYEARCREIIDGNVDTVRALPNWRGRDIPVWVTEAYVTPGDLGRPESKEVALDAWRLAALDAAKASKAAAFIAYGIRPSEIEGPTPWLRYGGWGETLAKRKKP